MRTNRHIPFPPGILAAVLVFVPILTGCPFDPPPATIRSSSPLGLPMVLSGPVYIWDEATESYTGFRGSRTVSPGWPGDDADEDTDDGTGDDIGTIGEIADGHLRFTVGSPPAGELMDVRLLFEGYGDIYEGFAIRPANTTGSRAVRGIRLHGLETAGDGMQGWVNRLNAEVLESDSIPGRTYSILDEVYYIYVDWDVIITGSGLSGGEDGFAWNFENISIKLEAGWNVMHVRSVETVTEYSFSQNVSITAADPAWVKWQMWEFENNGIESGGGDGNGIQWVTHSARPRHPAGD